MKDIKFNEQFFYYFGFIHRILITNKILEKLWDIPVFTLPLKQESLFYALHN